MTDNVRRIDGPKPPSLRENDTARGVALMHKLLARVDKEPSLVVGDAEYLILLMRRLGKMGDAFEFAHTDLDGEAEDMCVSLLAWLLGRERDRAA